MKNYTGRKDKNNKKIYVGNLLKIPSVLDDSKYGIRQVSFQNGQYYAGSNLNMFDMNYVEIIKGQLENILKK